MSTSLIHAGAIGSTSHAALSVDIPALGVPELRQMLHTADGPKEIRTRRIMPNGDVIYDLADGTSFRSAGPKRAAKEAAKLERQLA